MQGYMYVRWCRTSPRGPGGRVRPARSCPLRRGGYRLIRNLRMRVGRSCLASPLRGLAAMWTKALTATTVVGFILAILTHALGIRARRSRGEKGDLVSVSLSPPASVVVTPTKTHRSPILIGPGVKVSHPDHSRGRNPGMVFPSPSSRPCRM